MGAAADVFVAKADFVWTLGGRTGKPVRHGSASLREGAWTPATDALVAKLDIPVG